jgi:hypothetical protein
MSSELEKDRAVIDAATGEISPDMVLRKSERDKRAAIRFSRYVKAVEHMIILQERMYAAGTKPMMMAAERIRSILESLESEGNDGE